MFQLRPYQTEAIDAVHNFLCTKVGNPCVSMPTGSGKSPTMAALIQKWKLDHASLRGIVLAHRKELVKQNHEKFLSIFPECHSGIYSAGLRQRDTESSIIFASIDSVYNKSGEFSPFDFIFVDEAHRIPFSGEGKYRTFLGGCKRFNDRLCVVGWTATAWRMAGGQLCHHDHILTDLVYDANVATLIEQGYLSNIRSKVGRSQPDLDGVARYSGGDYKAGALSTAVNRDRLVEEAISEAVRIIKAEGRKAIVFYCVDVQHCERVSSELRRYGVTAPCVTSKTSQVERDKILSAFQKHYISAICNVNVLTEGFDAPHIDCVVLLRPTLSAGLFSQMVGRGLRLFDGKSYCLVLDFAGCIDEHGPIDLLGGAKTVLAVCGRCRESFSRALRSCPICGWEIPPREIERIEQVEKERRMHGEKPSNRSILSREPETLTVTDVYVARHKKPYSPDSVCVRFRCGLRMFSMWLCFNHPGATSGMARAWWRKYIDASRANGNSITVDAVCGDLFISETILSKIKTVTVKKNGKYFEIIDYNQPVIEQVA